MNVNDYKLFKWIGGKAWLSKQLNTKIDKILKNNNEINTYVEPFCGGLGSFLSLYDTLINNNIKKVVLNDINHNLITLYDNVKNRPQELINAYTLIEKANIETIPLEAYNLHKTKDKVLLKEVLNESNNYFKEKRKELNDLNKKIDSSNEIQRSSLLLFLLKHNFNGIYRENRNGEINSPFNWEAMKINFKELEVKIKNLSELFNSIEIKFYNLNIKDFIKDFNFNKDKTLFYYDPPYINEDRNTENNYSGEGFNHKEQFKLIDYILNNNRFFLYSNHSNDLIIDKFKNYNITFLERKNIISSNPLSRENIKMELLVSSISSL